VAFMNAFSFFKSNHFQPVHLCLFKYSSSGLASAFHLFIFFASLSFGWGCGLLLSSLVVSSFLGLLLLDFGLDLGFQILLHLSQTEQSGLGLSCLSSPVPKIKISSLLRSTKETKLHRPGFSRSLCIPRCPQQCASC
jgi:hypothetical protein